MDNKRKKTLIQKDPKNRKQLQQLQTHNVLTEDVEKENCYIVICKFITTQ